MFISLCSSSHQEPLQSQKSRLDASFQLQQFFRDAEDEEVWIKEREPLASSTNTGASSHSDHLQSLFLLRCVVCYLLVRLCHTLLYAGKDLTAVQSLQKKHQTLMVCTSSLSLVFMYSSRFL